MARIFPAFGQQKEWIEKLRRVDRHVKTAHNPSHILEFLAAIFALKPDVTGSIVEAGAFKGGGTAKISLATKHAGRQLVVFDSFEGLPENTEEHQKSVLGHSIEGWFKAGNFNGSLDEVKQNVTNYGDISVCSFIKGWFEDTMPSFKQPIALAYLDVDLALKDKAKWMSSVLAFAANTYLNAANPYSPALPPRIVQFHAERNMNKGFINLLIRSVLAGLKETVFMSKENKKDYGDKKKELKRSKALTLTYKNI